MPIVKRAAIVPRPLRNITAMSLTVKTLVLLCLCAVSGWLLMDWLYQRNVETLVTDSWQSRLEQDARDERNRLRQALTAFADTAWFQANYQPLQAQLVDWNASLHMDFAPQVFHWKPDWLATLHSVDSKIPITHALVLDLERKVRGIYSSTARAFPEILLSIAADSIGAEATSPIIVADEGNVYLVSLAPVAGVQGSVLIASLMDNAFLQSVLGYSSSRSRSALLFGNEYKKLIATNGAMEGEGLYLIADELVLADASGRELRHAVWIDRAQLSSLGERLAFSVREQRTFALIIFAGLFSVMLAWIANRLRKVHGLVDDYAERMGFVLPEVGGGDQIAQLEKRLERIGEEVIAETSALEYQAQHDNLTNLPNRSLLMERLEVELQACREHGETLVLCLMDLDQFKEVNDTLGHHVGDRLLQEVGRRLVSVLRRSDTVARLGGDEFAILLPGADAMISKAICHKILAAMERPIKVEDLCLRAGMSIGVALCPEHGQDANLLMRYADIAMYEAKRKHKGFAFYTPDSDDHSVSRLGLSGELSDAIKSNQLMLEYQPMVDVKSGIVFCAEALVRWRHPEFGVVPPEEFIPTAEQTGVIRPLTLWVVDRALQQSAAWSSRGIHLKISVNLSVRSLQDRKLPGQVQTLINKHNIDPGGIILEVTESAIMSDPLTARRVMRRLSNMGFQLSIDDFGTGYSSLAYLKQLPVDEIKIDKSFVTQMDRDENDAVIVRATIDLAHNLGLKVVAEGVESGDVWDLLEMLGCDVAQGYFIRQPLGADDLACWLQSDTCKDAHWGTPLRLLRGTT